MHRDRLRRFDLYLFILSIKRHASCKRILLLLLLLCLCFKVIAASGVEDVRDVLDHYNQESDPVQAFLLRQQKLLVRNKKKSKTNFLSHRFV